VQLANSSGSSARVMLFLRDCAKVYLMYMIVGIAAVPAGAVYGFLVLNGYDRWWTATICVSLGVVSGAWAWARVRNRLYRPWRAQIAGTIYWPDQDTLSLYGPQLSSLQHQHGTYSIALEEFSRESIGTMQVSADDYAAARN
jgi:hypothetical protein